MQVVVASPLQPYRGAPSAGGELLRRHVEVLAEDHDVTVLVGDGIWQDFLPQAPLDSRVRIVPLGLQRRRRGRVRRRVDQLFPDTAFSSFWSAVRDEPAALAACRTADIIEMQWFELVQTRRSIRALGIGAPLVGVFHDVVSQRLWRELRHSKTLVGLASRAVRLVKVFVVERLVVRDLAAAVTFSAKDERLLRLASTAPDRISVLPPLLTDGSAGRDVTAAAPGQEVLMVADFSRAENRDGLRWFIDAVWPAVVERAPRAHLTLAGRGLRPGDLSLSAEVEVTGYQESLDRFYARASVAVSPLRRGAGVKLKSIVPMLWGVPVVSTRVGAEGIAADWFAGVHDDAESFAQRVVSVLTDRCAYEAQRCATRLAAREAHGADAHRLAAAQVFERALAVSAANGRRASTERAASGA